MELTFGKKTKKEERPSLKTLMVTWPECFYKEKEPALRLALLGEAERQGLTPQENVIRRKYIEKRYTKAGRDGSVTADLYLKLWLLMSYAADTTKKAKVPRSAERDIRKLYKELGFDEPISEEEKILLYQELYHMAILYINLSLEDKSYGSLLLGFGRMSDQKLAQKIGRDCYKVGYRVPEILKLENREFWEQVIQDAYGAYFPDEREYLTDLIKATEAQN